MKQFVSKESSALIFILAKEFQEITPFSLHEKLSH
jgi:hypothetical protein